MAKNPKIAGKFAAIQKRPREAVDQDEDLNPSWRFGRIDFEGPWCPKILDQAKLLEVTQKLGQLETQRWPDLVRHGSHPVETHKLIKEARDRLKALKLDDIGTMYSLRLSGTNRLWGVKIRNVFLAIWWDPDHKVCPSILKHT